MTFLPDELTPYISEPIAVVYFLFKSGELVYIGSTGCLSYRLKTHIKSKQFDDVKYIATNTIEEARAQERGLILKYRPPYNRTLVEDPPYPAEKIISNCGREFKKINRLLRSHKLLTRDLSRTITTVIKKRGITMKEIQKVTGLKPATIANKIAGTDWTLGELKSMADFFGITITELVE